MVPDTATLPNNMKVSNICPFCSLMCEDTVPARDSDLARMPCPLARSGYRGGAADFAEAMINGKSCSRQQAYREACRILRRAKRPLLAGLDTDVAGIRAAINLAQHCNGILDHLHGDAISAYAAIMREARWFGTTLAELRQRADVLLCINCDFSTVQPRLLHRTATPGQKKKLLLLASGNIPETLPKSSYSRMRADIPEHEISAAIACISMYLRGLNINRRKVATKDVALWRRYATALRQAKYVGIVWKATGSTTARLSGLRQIMQFAEFLNNDGRAGIYTAIDGAGTTTAMQTGLWLTGYPLRVWYNKGSLEYDPVRFATRRLLRNREVDALVWISSTADAKVPAAPGIPKIILGRGDLRPPQDITAKDAAVYIPVATPGINDDGVLFRGDSVVALPLTARGSKQPGVAAALDTIAAGISK